MYPCCVSVAEFSAQMIVGVVDGLNLCLFFFFSRQQKSPSASIAEIGTGIAAADSSSPTLSTTLTALQSRLLHRFCCEMNTPSQDDTRIEWMRRHPVGCLPPTLPISGLLGVNPTELACFGGRLIRTSLVHCPHVLAVKMNSSSYLRFAG